MSNDSKTENIKCFLRCRPFNEKEKDLNVKCINICSDKKTIMVENKNEQTKNDMRKLRYTMDKVFDEGITQEEIFNEVGMPLISSFLKGYNCTLFCYGPTGTGKTHTMMGPLDSLNETNSLSSGLIPRILDFLFNENDKVDNFLTNNKSQSSSEIKKEIRACCFEIYQENIIDLLGSYDVLGQAQNEKIKLKEDAKKGMFIDGITECVVKNAKEAKNFILKGLKSRHVAATEINAESSRSHLIFTLYITASFILSKGEKVSKSSRIHLIDLAGSERQTKTKAEGTRLKEAATINKSLSALGNVINALVENCEGKKTYVPFRDSKLTHFLKDSLGGNSKTVICANISLSLIQMNETISTLNFIQRAKMIKNKAIVNIKVQENINALIEENKQLREIIESHICPICNNKPYEYNEDKYIENSKEDFIKLINTVSDNFQYENKIKEHFNNLQSELNGSGKRFMDSIDKYKAQSELALKEIDEYKNKFKDFLEFKISDFEEIKKYSKKFKDSDILSKALMEKIITISDSITSLKAKLNEIQPQEYLKLKIQNESLITENIVLNEYKEILNKSKNTQFIESEISSHSNEIKRIVDAFNKSNTDIKTFISNTFLDSKIFKDELIILERSDYNLLKLQIDEAKMNERSLKRKIDELENDNFLLSVDIIRFKDKQRRSSIINKELINNSVNQVKDEDKLSQVDSDESYSIDSDEEDKSISSFDKREGSALLRAKSRRRIFRLENANTEKKYLGVPNGLTKENLEILKMKEAIDDATGEIKQKENVISELNRQIYELNEQIEKGNLKIQELELESKQLHEQIDALDTTNELYEKNIIELNNERKNVEDIVIDVVNMVQKNINVIQECGDIYNNDIGYIWEMCRQIINSYYKELLKAKEDLNIVKDKLKQSEGELVKVKDDLEKTTNNYNKVNNELSDIKKELLAVKVKQLETNETLLKSNDDLKTLNGKLEQTLNELKETKFNFQHNREELLNAKEEIKNLTQIHDKLNQSNEKLKDELDINKEELLHSQSEISIKDEELNKIKNSLIITSNEINNVNNEFTITKDNLTLKEEELTQSKNELNKLKCQLNKSQTESKEEMNKITQLLSITKDDLSKSISELAYIKEQLTITNNIISEENESISHNDEILTKINIEYNEIKDKFNISSSELKKTTQELSLSKEKLNQTKEQILQLQKRLTYSHESENKINKTLIQTKSELLSTKDNLTKISEELSIVKEKILYVNKQNDDLKNNITTLTKEKNELININEKNSKIIELLEINKLKSQDDISNLITKNKLIVKEVEDKEKAIALLSIENKEAKNTIECLQCDILQKNKIINTIENKEIEYKEKIKHQQSELITYINDNQKLKQEKEELNSKLILSVESETKIKRDKESIEILLQNKIEEKNKSINNLSNAHSQLNRKFNFIYNKYFYLFNQIASYTLEIINLKKENNEKNLKILSLQSTIDSLHNQNKDMNILLNDKINELSFIKRENKEQINSLSIKIKSKEQIFTIAKETVKDFNLYSKRKENINIYTLVDPFINEKMTKCKDELVVNKTLIDNSMIKKEIEINTHVKSLGIYKDKYTNVYNTVIKKICLTKKLFIQKESIEYNIKKNLLEVYNSIELKERHLLEEYENSFASFTDSKVFTFHLDKIKLSVLHYQNLMQLCDNYIESNEIKINFFKSLNDESQKFISSLNKEKTTFQSKLEFFLYRNGKEEQPIMKLYTTILETINKYLNEFKDFIKQIQFNHTYITQTQNQIIILKQKLKEKISYLQSNIIPVLQSKISQNANRTVTNSEISNFIIDINEKLSSFYNEQYISQLENLNTLITQDNINEYQNMLNVLKFQSTHSLKRIKREADNSYNAVIKTIESIAILQEKNEIISTHSSAYLYIKPLLTQKENERRNKILEDKLIAILGSNFKKENLYNDTPIKILWNTTAIPKLAKQLMILKEEKQKIQNDITLLNTSFHNSLTDKASDSKIKMLLQIKEENTLLKQEISILKENNKSLNERINMMSDYAINNRNYNTILDTILLENNDSNVYSSNIDINEKFSLAMSLIKEKNKMDL